MDFKWQIVYDIGYNEMTLRTLVLLLLMLSVMKTTTIYIYIYNKHEKGPYPRNQNW